MIMHHNQNLKNAHGIENCKICIKQTLIFKLILPLSYIIRIKILEGDAASCDSGIMVLSRKPGIMRHNCNDNQKEWKA